jgi:fatty-acyl-CoA synthase
MGLSKGDRLALVIPEGHEFVLSFFGAVVAGVVPVPIVPRATFKGVDGYVDILDHIVAASGARVLLSMESLRPIVDKVLERDSRLETVAMCESAFDGETPAFERPAVEASDLCFLQFTSGSTSRPKGVQVTHENLVTNASCFLGPAPGLDRNDDDVGVSWLPLYHDMGLIGFILGTIVCDIPVVIIPTAQFARAPLLWLQTIHEYRGTITYAPNFGYELAAKRVKDKDLDNLDLSCIRVAGCGAEPIRAKSLAAFADRLAPAGFDGDKAYLPSYGMAESTLAITFHALGTPIVVDRVDPVAMKNGKAVPSASTDALELVSCGVPFEGHELRITDDDGRALDEREVGEIVIRGDSVTAGYYKNEEATSAAFREGFLRTGDLGYVADGNLYVCGRVKDLIIINGANHYPQDIEWMIGDLPGVRRGNVVAFSVMTDGREELVLAAEGSRADAAELRKLIATKVAEGFGLRAMDVAIVPVGTLPKTSSGKAQRRKTKQMYEDGAMPAHP